MNDDSTFARDAFHEAIYKQPMKRDDPKQGRFQLFYTPGLKGKPIIRVVAEDMVQTFLVPNDAPKPTILAQFALKPEDQGKPIAELEQLYPYARK